MYVFLGCLQAPSLLQEKIHCKPGQLLSATLSNLEGNNDFTWPWEELEGNIFVHPDDSPGNRKSQTVNPMFLHVCFTLCVLLHIPNMHILSLCNILFHTNFG